MCTFLFTWGQFAVRAFVPFFVILSARKTLFDQAFDVAPLLILATGNGTGVTSPALHSHQRQEVPMRGLLRTTALALVLAGGVAAAQTPSQQTQTSPQNGKSPAATEREANEAAKERIEAAPSAKDATIEDARGGEGHPKPDQIVGPPNAGPVPLRGDGPELPGATRQTAPAKFSAENAEKLNYSIMGYPVQLSDDQKKAIWQSIGSKSETASSQGKTIHAEAGVFLPPAVQAEDLPGNLNQQIPSVRGLKYVKTDNKILLVAPSNGIVRGVIEE
jgi:hypothetical protein